MICGSELVLKIYWTSQASVWIDYVVTLLHNQVFKPYDSSNPPHQLVQALLVLWILIMSLCSKNTTIMYNRIQLWLQLLFCSVSSWCMLLMNVCLKRISLILDCLTKLAPWNTLAQPIQNSLWQELQSYMLPLKARSHCDSNGVFVSVQYPFMMAMAMEKMGIMVTNWSVHIVMAMA